MNIYNTLTYAAPTLTVGGIAVLPTDTLYGVVGQALQPSTVQRIYSVKERTPSKPFIILISGIEDVQSFGVALNDGTRQILEKYWPGPVSIILDCPLESLAYLHRGQQSLAFRLPAKPELVALIKKTGPLVAPSANPEGLPPAATIQNAVDYFGDKVDCYIEGDTNEKASKILRIVDSNIQVIRD